MFEKKWLFAVLILLLLCVAGATAAGEGVLSASNVTDVAKDENGTVTYTLTNDFDPGVGSLTYVVYYDETIATAVETETIVSGGQAPTILESGMSFAAAVSVPGIPNDDAKLFNITFKSHKDDGSSMDLGIVVVTARDVMVPPTDLRDAITVINGTFTTKDEVAPVINNITTPVNVGANFQITGYITEVGGLDSATATLTNGSATENMDLSFTNLGNGLYSYTVDASWTKFEDITLTVNAEDVAGNAATPVSKTITVANVGFSNPLPLGAIKDAPTNVSVFMSNINTSSPVAMTLSGAVGPLDLDVSIDGDYAIGDLSAIVLTDGQYSVNVTGRDTIADEERFLPWTFILDTSEPTLDVTVTDSDGDGYIEANEDLTFDWEVTNPGVSEFRGVQLFDKGTEEIIWSSLSADGSATMDLDFGNRDLSFRAYDNAGNFAAYDFHLYNNYVVWVNSTKVGTVGGLNTEFTSAVDLDLTATSMVQLFNGRSVFAPDIGTVTRQVKDVGQVTSDTYVTVDNRANATYAGTDTYQTLWVYEPLDIIDFEITAPAITHASVMMVEANESYLNELIDSQSTSNIDYTKLVKQAAYIFIDGGWTQITVNQDGTFTQDQIVGEPLTVSSDITTTLKNAANQVDLSSGFRLSEDAVGFDASTNPEIGDYAVAAIAFDGDRIGGIAVMPVVVLETDDEGTISADSVTVNGTFDASFVSDCKYFGVALYRDAEYNATAIVDFANLNYDMVTAYLSVDGAATEQLWHNIYITPGAGKYAYVKNGNSLSFDVTGLEAGDYKAVLAGLSNNGTGQALGIHDLTITPATSFNISNVVVATGTTAAYVTWDTNIAANSTVEYGSTAAYGANVSSADLVTAHALSISGLSPTTTYHYRITSYDAAGNMAVTTDAVFTTRSSGGGGGGGGGGGFVAPTTPVQEFTTTGTLQTDSSGFVQNSVIVYAGDKLSYLFISEGVQALKANGQPVTSVTIEETQNVPSPGASTFVFAGHAVKLGPAGATFNPGIELTFQLTEEEWNALKPGESFTIKWFNDGTGEWEDIPTTVNPFTHTVIGEITHFSTFAVFKQVAGEPTPVVTQTPSPTQSPGETPVATATPAEPVTDGGFPWVWVIVVIVLIAVIGGGYYYMQQKND